MKDLQITLEGKWTNTSSDLLEQYIDGPKNNVPSLEDEGKEFTNELRRVIIHEEIKHSDD